MDYRADEEAPLVSGEDRKGRAGKSYTRDVHILSISFLLIFLAYGAAQNLETTVNKDLGTISLGILYVSFMFCSMVASLVVRSMGSKNALVLGTTGYWLFVAANLKPSWFTMVPASLYLGFAASIIWVGQGTYLTSIARSHAKDHGVHEGSVIGVFNGEFWAMFACHQLFGNLITLALLKDGKEGSTSGTTLLMLVFLFSMTLGTILMFFIRNIDGEDGKENVGSPVGLVDSLVSLPRMIITPLLDIRMLLIVPLLAYSGLQQAFVWAEFTKEIVTPAIGVSGVGGAMAVYGALDAVCSMTAGRFTSGLSSITFIVSGGVLAQASIFLWILLGYGQTSGVLGTAYPLIMAAILGIGDGILNTQISALLALLFKHDTEGAFAQLKVWQSAAIAIVFFLSPYISLQAMVIVMLVMVCVSLVSFLFLALKVEKVFTHDE
ncbi:PREDICTED: UNC93-like protein 3 isoform X1 [Camelina sativa]|uniref:UNC93-like protein 3 isoform X1 n=1 Tax=Camelina sativa TaxID=90675 RepID=A0ABM0XIK7_CAMSA|nr:PREDICTED: UNC93-like protein 3 isoform X1 [Camelina sativa]